MAGQTPFNAQTASSTTPGGVLSALNLTAGANLVKATAGKIMRLSVNTAGTAGTLTVYDSATTAGIGAASLVWSGTATQTTGIAPITLEWPCLNGIVVVAPTGGVVSVSFV